MLTISTTRIDDSLPPGWGADKRWNSHVGHYPQYGQKALDWDKPRLLNRGYTLIEAREGYFSEFAHVCQFEKRTEGCIVVLTYYVHAAQPIQGEISHETP